MEWFKKYISESQRIAIKDSFGLHDYSTFFQTTEKNKTKSTCSSPDKLLFGASKQNRPGGQVRN